MFIEYIYIYIFFPVVRGVQLTEEEKEQLAVEAAKKAARKHKEGGGLNPLAVLVLLFAIAVGE